MTSVFNVDEFLNRSHEGGFATKRPHLPAKEYPAQLAEGKAGMDVKTVTVDGEVRYVLALNWEVIDDEAKAITGMDKPRVKQDIWLDIDANGHLVKDKLHNVDLGRVLSGLGLNSDSFLFSQLRTVGLVKIKVTEEPDKKKSNPDGSPIIYNRVTAVTRFNGA